MTSVAVVGLGKLGAPLALLFAEAGLDVTGVDTNIDLLAKLRMGTPTHHERGFPQMLDDFGPLVTWSMEIPSCDAVFVVVPTPSLPSGAFDVSSVGSVAEHVARCGLSPVLCCVSTVNPGDCEGQIAEAVTGGGVRIVYSPEFVAIGDVFAGMRRPDLTLIGETDRAAGDLVLTCLRAIKHGSPWDLPEGQTYIAKTPAIHRMTLTEAELAKLAVNAYVTMKISYANTLGELSSAYSARGAVVTAAVGADSRIGAKYLRPGGAYGGPCFPRDGLAFQQAADKVGLRAPLAAATDAVNYRQQRRTAATVARVAGRGARVVVLGTAYKPGTEVTERSFGEAVARELAWAGFDVVTHDPLADCTQPDLGLALDGADVAVLATDDPAWVAHTFAGLVVVDPWGLPIITTACTYEAVA